MPTRVIFACEFRWVNSALNAWNLRGSEPHNFVVAVISEIDVKIVEVSACCAHDDDFLLHRYPAQENSGVSIVKRLDMNVKDEACA